MVRGPATRLRGRGAPGPSDVHRNRRAGGGGHVEAVTGLGPRGLAGAGGPSRGASCGADSVGAGSRRGRRDAGQAASRVGACVLGSERGRPREQKVDGGAGRVGGGRAGGERRDGADGRSGPRPKYLPPFSGVRRRRRSTTGVRRARVPRGRRHSHSRTGAVGEPPEQRRRDGGDAPSADKAPNHARTSASHRAHSRSRGLEAPRAPDTRRSRNQPHFRPRTGAGSRKHTGQHRPLAHTRTKMKGPRRERRGGREASKDGIGVGGHMASLG